MHKSSGKPEADLGQNIPIQKVNEAYERLLKSDVKYRFSIDMASLKSESSAPRSRDTEDGK